MIYKKKSYEFGKWEREIVFPYILRIFDNVSSICLIYHMIEQYEDIYTYMINGEEIIKIEISRVDGNIILDSITSVLEYAKEMKGKQYQRYLKELLELSNREDCQV
ncbi:hypothetical protein [Klebsiella spallanzanii]|uniref:Uncharacterized protein n=1 Tax=Klebsiella spallanzanii TaxID=2587528 RepID=A0A564NF02_9ENTR|nr:hypothetical protein [Klebsiella spallanzanii]VUT04658.1 hypothetical protein SB6408_02213 [Klebsiella spallanzanii]